MKQVALIAFLAVVLGLAASGSALSLAAGGGFVLALWITGNL
jgi:hypothetical protein